MLDINTHVDFPYKKDVYLSALLVISIRQSNFYALFGIYIVCQHWGVLAQCKQGMGGTEPDIVGTQL